MRRFRLKARVWYFPPNDFPGRAGVLTPRWYGWRVLYRDHDGRCRVWRGRRLAVLLDHVSVSHERRTRPRSAPVKYRLRTALTAAKGE